MEPALVLDEEKPDSPRRARVRAVLERRKLTDSVSAEQASASWEQDRFVARARALFYARLVFLTLGLALLAVPRWSFYFGLQSVFAFAGYFAMLLYRQSTVHRFRRLTNERIRSSEISARLPGDAGAALVLSRLASFA